MASSILKGLVTNDGIDIYEKEISCGELPEPLHIHWQYLKRRTYYFVYSNKI